MRTLPGSARTIFAEHGHEAETVIEESLRGASDSRVMEACQSEQRVLFTLDSDFGDIRTYPPSSHSGVVILHPPTQDIETILAMLRRALQVLHAEQISAASG